MFKFTDGQIVEHKTLGKGEIIYLDEVVGSGGRINKYYDIHFDNDSKNQVRTFNETTLLDPEYFVQK